MQVIEITGKEQCRLVEKETPKAKDDFVVVKINEAMPA